jgi:hypothetical protein
MLRKAKSVAAVDRAQHFDESLFEEKIRTTVGDMIS